MAFSQPASVDIRPAESALSGDMAGIGMNFGAVPNFDANIEQTLIYASEVGMEDHDIRVLSVLTNWLATHSHRVNADRLVRGLVDHPAERVRAYWSAVARWLRKDRRFARLIKIYDGDPLDLLPVGTDFQIGRRGEDERFEGSVLRAPAGSIRKRASDVMSPEMLARLHPGYRNRVLMGPTWRADVWTVLERFPDLTVSEAARRAGSSFATAWQVARDFRLLHAGV